ncbi:MAG: M67 family metallopeptidase [Myxococcota bacterium]
MPLGQLTVSAAALRAIHAHAAEGWPHEVVGILAGVPGRVTDVAALVNERADSPRNRYAVSGLTVLRAQQRLEADGHTILGYYHSHPDHPAIASDTDRDNALPNLSYLIVSVRTGIPVDTRSWVLRDDRSAMDEQPVRLETE